MPKSSLEVQDEHFVRIAQAIDFIRQHAPQQPTLSEVAAAVNLSEHHLQRTFAAWVGISPKRFLQYLTKEHARRSLRASADVFAAMETGLSSPGRLHDLMVTCEAMTPGEIQKHGCGVSVGYGLAGTPFGTALIAWAPRGICHLAFCDGDAEERKGELVSRWPGANLRRDDARAADLAARAFPATPCPGRLHLVLRGTDFQIKVWEALLDVGPSRLITYGRLARLSGSPRAQRAVGNAVASNSIAFLIPCHRVIRNNGEVGRYRWGTGRKAAMLAWEAARQP